MTFVRFAGEDESVSYGVFGGEEIQPLDGSPFATWSEQGAPVALNTVRLLAPVEPSKGLALARNFRALVIANALDFSTDLVRKEARVEAEIAQLEDLGFAASQLDLRRFFRDPGSLDKRLQGVA